jgi:uncharacterized protein YbcI
MPRPKEDPENIRKNHYGTRPLTIYFSLEETHAIDRLRGNLAPREFLVNLISAEEQKAREQA